MNRQLIIILATIILASIIPTMNLAFGVRTEEPYYSKPGEPLCSEIEHHEVACYDDRDYDEMEVDN